MCLLVNFNTLFWKIMICSRRLKSLIISNPSKRERPSKSSLKPKSSAYWYSLFVMTYVCIVATAFSSQTKLIRLFERLKNILIHWKNDSVILASESNWYMTDSTWGGWIHSVFWTCDSKQHEKLIHSLCISLWTL